MKSQIDTIRESKQPLSLQWVFLGTAILLLAIVIFNVVSNRHGSAILGSLASSIFLLCYVILRLKQTHRELLGEIDSLREIVNEFSALKK